MKNGRFELRDRKPELWIIGITALLLLILLIPEVSLGASEFEVPENRRASDVLPPEMISGPYHRVRDAIVCYGYMHHYTVDSQFGTCEVTGDGALRKLLNEIRAIAILKDMAKSKVYLDAVAEAGKQPLEFSRNLITDPVDTITGIPKGVNRLFETVTTSLTKGKDPSEDTRAQKVLAVSTFKRDYAAALGVDPYSSNSVLQKELNGVAWAGALGSLTVTAALAPFGGPAAVGLKSSRLAQQLNDLLKNEPPERLRQINTENLSSIGVKNELIEKLLDHPAYTPRHDTLLVASLASLKGVKIFDGFIQMALTADDEEAANFFVTMAQVMRAYNETVSPIQRITGLYPLVFAKAANGKYLMPFPLDYGMWTERADHTVPRLIEAYIQTNPDADKNFELWVTGTVTPLAKQEMTGLGVNVVEDVDTRIEIID
jgi:hypothetical protein